MCMCSDSHGRKYESDHKSHGGGGKLQRTVTYNCVFAMYKPWYQNGYGHEHIEEKRAVEAGYWHLYRYTRCLKSKARIRYSGVERTDHSLQGVPQGRNQIFTACECIPGCGGEMFDAAERDARERYETYKRLAEQKYS